MIYDFLLASIKIDFQFLKHIDNQRPPPRPSSGHAIWLVLFMVAAFFATSTFDVGRLPSLTSPVHLPPRLRRATGQQN